MIQVEYKSNQKASIDIHNMTVDTAKRQIEQYLSRVNGSIKEIEIIHGYTSGTALRDMVRKRLKHTKIKGKVISMNPGITILIL